MPVLPSVLLGNNVTKTDKDRYDRQLFVEPIPEFPGGFRYFDEERTICIGLPGKDDKAAKEISDENPPPKFQKKPEEQV